MSQPISAQQAPNNPIDTAPAEISSDAFSCPVPGGRITNHSYQADPVNGHCGQIYSTRYNCNCGNQGRRAKAIDVATDGGDVFLPQIGGKDVNWYLHRIYSVTLNDGGGNGYIFETEAGGAKWFIDFVHIASAPVEERQTYPSGTNLGKISEDHVHFTIGKNLANIPVPATETDCDPNWLPSEFACDSNAPVPTTTGTRPSFASSQVTKSSNRLCVKVGTPATEKPAACTAPVNPALPGVAAGEAPPVPAGELVQTIRSQYGVDMKGAWDEAHLQWIYQKFYELSQTNPKFIQLLSRETIELSPGDQPNQEAGWVKMPNDGSWADQNNFIPVLIHELGHAVYWNKADAGALTSKYDNLYKSNGNPVLTGYAAKYGGEPRRMQENYAEVIAYCLTGDGVYNHMEGGPGFINLEYWATYYKTLAEEITGGACRR